MNKKFDKPELPSYRSTKQLPSGSQPSSTTSDKKTAEEIHKKYEKTTQRVCNLMGLSDATGSMSGLWDSTRKHITEMIKRISELGKFEVRWVAYRDYGDGNNIIQPSDWSNQAKPLLDFINSIQCFGGDDFEEAVERALEFAARDSKVTRVVLIGDAPPHPNKDYREQANALARLQRPVFSFVVGNHPDTIRSFKEIAEITGGKSMLLTKAEDLLDVVVLTAVDDMGGEESVREYIDRYAGQLSDGGRKYAQLLLGEGNKGD